MRRTRTERPARGFTRLRAAMVPAAAALAVTPLLAGCGIRSTTVPVDAGPAPSRASCAAPKVTETSKPDAVVRQVYLVCSMQIAPVGRDMSLRNGAIDRISRVRELISQLEISPRPDETKDGFSTAVPGTLEVDLPAKGDPRDALRLNTPVDELPSFVLAQIVCTLTADSLIAPAAKVTLGGPPPDQKLRSYSCTSELRTRPAAADTAGTPVH